MKPYSIRLNQIKNKFEPNTLAILSAAEELPRNGDAHFPFRQNSNFYYLTGFNEPQAVLIILGGPQGKTILFNRLKDQLAEQWTGTRLGQQGAVQHLGVDEAYPIQELEAKFLEYAAEMETFYYSMGTDSVAETLVLKTLHQLKRRHRRGATPDYQMKDLEPMLSEMRLFKSQEEIVLMQKAAECSVLAHQRAMKRCKSLKYEYELEAELRYVFTKEGCRSVAYEPIVAAGKNACILHYTENRAPLIPGEMVLIDAAGEYENYAADITRTFPINGRFSAEQRALYDLVLHAQRSAIDLIKPGTIWSKLQETIIQILIQGLCDLGILKGNVDDLIAQKAYLPFYMHGSGHWLGLDVHDCGAYKIGNEYRPLEPGMVFTVEPGLYIPDSSDVPEKWRGIGIRIEDDLLVTEEGYRNLTEQLVVRADDIEAWMQNAE